MGCLQGQCSSLLPSCLKITMAIISILQEHKVALKKVFEGGALVLFHPLPQHYTLPGAISESRARTYLGIPWCGQNLREKVPVLCPSGATYRQQNWPQNWV